MNTQSRHTYDDVEMSSLEKDKSPRSTLFLTTLMTCCSIMCHRFDLEKRNPHARVWASALQRRAGAACGRLSHQRFRHVSRHRVFLGEE